MLHFRTLLTHSRNIHKQFVHKCFSFSIWITNCCIGRFELFVDYIVRCSLE